MHGLAIFGILVLIAIALTALTAVLTNVPDMVKYARLKAM